MLETLERQPQPTVAIVNGAAYGGADQALYLNQGCAQGGVTGKFVRQTWFDPGDYISYGTALFDMDHDGDLDVLQTAAGSVIIMPPDAFAVRLFQNTQL